MSATTTIASLPRSASTLSFGGVIRSEWIKLRSLRSTVWSYLIVIAISLGMAFVMSISMVGTMDSPADLASTPAAQQQELILMASTFGVFFGQLVVAVLGVLVITGEYSTGMIRSTLTAVPKRLPALAAKALVLFVSTFVIGLLSTVGAFIVASIVYGANGASASITDPDVFLSLLGGALYLALVSLFALGLGAMLRSSAGGIAAALGTLLLLPMVLQMIPAEWASDLIPYLLSTAGMGIFGQTSFTGEIDSVIENLLIVLAWVAAALVGAGILLKRRDA
ncbi:ABC-2 type transport system permease protein [Microterricola gilva]|uniref:ABC-2 type transport system permease protein n=1 Tax=Microterricola gilva TaxID=393267 RepID=A0A4Q8ALE1_9MICO|nr:ABC transporter permease [Microterricola gilva]RZU64861.1 ABC-2 type transport system permease protein [Microterricola gilva]